MLTRLAKGIWESAVKIEEGKDTTVAIVFDTNVLMA